MQHGSNAGPEQQQAKPVCHTASTGPCSATSAHCNRPSRLSATLGTPVGSTAASACTSATVHAHDGCPHHALLLREHSLSGMLTDAIQSSNQAAGTSQTEQHSGGKGGLTIPESSLPPPASAHAAGKAAPSATPLPLAAATPAAVPPHAVLAGPANPTTAVPPAPQPIPRLHMPHKDADDNGDDDDADGAPRVGCSRDSSCLLPLDHQTWPWYKSPGKLAVLILLVASAGLVLAGLMVQITLEEEELLGSDTANSIKEAYPWLYFFSAWAPLALAFRWLCWRLYKAAEYTAIREELYFLRPLRAKVASVLFWLTNLLWFQVCFKWVWCHSGRCKQAAYQEALGAVWKLLICLALFSVANFTKCGLARFLSYSFYKTAHFKKVKEAIERELYLIRLSKARSVLLPSPPTPSPAAPGTGAGSEALGLSSGRAGWLAERGSMLWRRASLVFAQGARPSVTAAARDVAEDAAMPPVGCQVVHEKSSPARAVAAVSPFSAAAGTDEQGSGGCVDSGQVTAYIQLMGGPAGAAPKLHQQHQKSQQHKPLSDDGVPLLNISSNSSGKQQHNTATPAAAPHNGRQPSFEEFCRVPSLLGPAALKTGSSGLKLGSLWRAGVNRAASKTSKAQGSRGGSRVSLHNMVPGVDGLLLQPEVVGEVATALGTSQQSFGGRRQPVTEEEMLTLRKALGVNTYSTFVDRYYGMSAKEEAAHVRHVKRFAKVLFFNIKGEADRDHLLPSDFMLFFDGDKDTAHDAFDYFDRNNDGSISCMELQESAAEMLCERKNIAASIKDTDSVVDSLETGLGLLIHFIFFIFYLLVWGINIVKGFSTFSATVLALTFVFGDSVKSVFESAIFLFVEHPYDVGDMLCMPPGNTLARVKKIDLMYTQLLRGNGELVWHPNSMMRQMVLVNVSRSSNKWEGHSLLVDIDTPDEVLETVQEAVAAHVAANPSQYSAKPLVTWKALEEPLKLRLAVGVTYSFTGEDIRRLLVVRTALLAVVRKVLRQQGVRYTLPTSGMGLPEAFAQQA